MHRLLQRILKKEGVSTERPPSVEEWQRILEKFDRVLVSNDEDRYLLNRSLEVSSREMEELFKASEKSYQHRITALIRVIPDFIFYVDEEGRYLDVLSPGKDKDSCLYVPRDKIIGRTFEDIFPREYAEMFRAAIRKAIRNDQLEIITYPLTVKNEKRFFEARIMPTNLREHEKKTLIAIVRDITAEKKSVDYLNMVKKIFEDATEGILITSIDGSYLEYNEAFARMLDLDSKNSIGHRLEDFDRFLDEGTLSRIVEAIERENFFRGEITIHRKEKAPILAWLTIDTVFDEKGEVTHRVAMLTDISELQKSREKLRYIATHDSLTQLPNRMLLMERLEEVLKRSERSGKGGALFFIDLDNFKEVNDRAGHGAGDKVLVECAGRLRKILRKSDTLGRFGGDEFLLIVENIDDVDLSMHIAEKVIREINKPIRIKSDIFEVGASIGIAFFPEDSSGIDELIQFADMAMYRAKEKGRNRFHYYSRRLDRDIKRNYRIKGILKKALEQNGFHLLYQPIFDLGRKCITGAEALIRLENTPLGPISPAEFIPIAEENDLIVKIGEWVFEECCRQNVEWREAGITELPVAINLSRRQLMDESWCSFVGKTIERFNVDPSLIEFEITETTFMHSREFGFQTIETLQNMGFRFSIDDFGTGYSSLANLKQFSVDKLKIDRSFVMNIDKDKSDRVIVNASILLAHALGQKVIAEGVETEEQRRILHELGCDEIQGYLIGRPMEAEKILQRLSSEPATG